MKPAQPKTSTEPGTPADDLERLDLPFRPCFGGTCCGVGIAINITDAQAALDDPVLILRSLSREDQRSFVAWYQQHSSHEPRIGIMAIAPMPTA